MGTAQSRSGTMPNLIAQGVNWCIEARSTLSAVTARSPIYRTACCRSTRERDN